LYGRRAAFFEEFQRRWMINAVLGAICMAASIAVGRMQGPALLAAYLYLCLGWLWGFAVIGAALRFMPAPSAALGYVADSAYWVYLVHLPVTIFFGFILYGMPWSPKLKIVINIACTSLVCLGSYALLVRYTWIGLLLNGRRQVR
ncbi:MAG: acyltransferase, partial [Gammaproteobacteria bacterium]|nr:acyltransferase [Gammaproteobacteria bacterium]MBU1442479.1 acyltransferase [Gammaproteobacteria bacterium]